MGVLDKVPKSFLLGVSLACIICVIGLLVHITVSRSSENEIPVPGKNGTKFEALSAKKFTYTVLSLNEVEGKFQIVT